MSDPYFSILMPLYNHEEFVGDAVKSVLNQIFEDFELIICDDGSTDQSLEVVSSFSDPRIKIWSKPNGGTTSALNSCLLRSKGEVICWLSADDIFSPHKLTLHFRAHHFNGARFSIANWGFLVDGEERPQMQERYWGVCRVLPQLTGNYINGLSVAINKNIFLQHGPFDQRFLYAQDYQRWLAILNTEEPFYIDGDAASFSRLGSSHLLNEGRQRHWCAWIDNCRALLDLTQHRGLFALVPKNFISQKEYLETFYITFLLKYCSQNNYFNMFGMHQLLAKYALDFENAIDFSIDRRAELLGMAVNVDHKFLETFHQSREKLSEKSSVMRAQFFSNLSSILTSNKDIKDAFDYYLSETKF